MKTSVHDLQEEVTVCVSSEEQKHVGNSCSKSQLYSSSRVNVVLQPPVVTFCWDSLEEHESRGLEEECCCGGAVVIIETMRTQARVTMFPLLQPGLADGAVHASMVHAAVELDVAAMSSPGDLTRFCLRTVAAVGRSSVLTPASVFTRLTLTLVDVHFTQLTCRKTNAAGGRDLLM